jgi:signal peptidase II
MTVSKYLHASLRGPLTGFGLVVALVVAVADQITKLWLLSAVGVGPHGGPPLTRLADLLLLPAGDANVYTPIKVAPFLKLVLTWNTGISYGLFPQVGPLGQWALLALKAIAVLLLWVWLVRAGSRLTALALGLIIGGAIGNAIDRVTHGAVVDFVLFYVTTATWTFEWYVFNLADCAIVAGVVGLLYESTRSRDAAKAP